MHAVVRISGGSAQPASGVREAALARVEALGRATGFVTLLAIQGDDGALVTVEIFETLDDMRAAAGAAGGDAHPSPANAGPEGGRTIVGEIVFQRGL